MTFLVTRFVLRYLRLGGFRTALSVLGVALGVCSFLAIRLSNASILDSFRQTINAVAGKADLEVRGGPTGLPDDLFPRALSTPGVLDAAPLIEWTAPVLRAVHSRSQNTRKGGNAAPALLIGIDPFHQGVFSITSGYSQYHPYSALAGAFLTDPNAVEVSESLAAAERLKVGGSFTILVGARRKVAYVVGILPDDPLSRAFGGRTIVMDIAAAQEFTGRVGRLDAILVRTAPHQAEAVRSRLRRIAPRDAVVERPSGRGAVVEKMLSAFALNLDALSLIALFVGMFLVYNTLSSSVVQRRVEIGILRATGVTRQQVQALVCAEAGMIGVAGSLLGTGTGYVLARMMLGTVAATASSLYVQVHPDLVVAPASMLAAASLIGTAAAVISALPAARDAVSESPATLVRRGAGRTLLRTSSVRFVVASLVPIAAAALSSVGALGLHVPQFGFAVCFFTLIAFSFWAPAFCSTLLAPLRRVALNLRSAAPFLAGALLLGSLDRVRVVVGALASALAMVVGVSTMVGSFRTTVGEWVDATVRGDVYISPAEGSVSGSEATLPPGVLERLKGLPKVTRIEPYRWVNLSYAGARIDLGARSFASLASHPAYRILRGRLDRGSLGRGEGILVSEPFADRFQVGPGSRISVSTPAGPRPFVVVGVFQDFTSDEGLVVMDLKSFQRLWRDYRVNSVALYTREGASSTVAREVERRLGAYAVIVRTNAALRREILRIFDQTFAVTYLLEFVAVVVALLGIASTLGSLAVQRRRQYATVRSLGATRWQIATIVAIEAILIAVASWLLGSLCGLALAGELVYIVLPGFFHWTVEFAARPAVFLLTAGITVPSALLAALGPALAASRVQPARVLRSE